MATGGTAAASLRPLRVLVVDDEPAVRQVLAAYCETDRHAVERAKTGTEALERLRARRFDGVLTDRAMPRMGGDELAAMIKREWPETPVILATGFGDLMVAAGERPQGVDAGVEAVIGKPITLARLREALAKVAPFS